MLVPEKADALVREADPPKLAGATNGYVLPLPEKLGPVHITDGTEANTPFAPQPPELWVSG